MSVELFVLSAKRVTGVPDPYPHHFVKLDPYPHQNGKLVRIRIKVKRWKPSMFILEHWRVQIWEKVNGRIRIRIRIKLKVGSVSE
jgi:hypothetical protein